MEASTNDSKPSTEPTTAQPEAQKDTVAQQASHQADTPAMAEFRKRVLNHPACVTLADERKIFGKIVCMDQTKNLVIVDAIEEIPQQYIAKLNKKMPIISRSIMKLKNFVKLPPGIEGNEEQLKKMEEEFFKNKFYLGQAIVPGHCIVKIEVQKA